MTYTPGVHCETEVGLCKYSGACLLTFEILTSDVKTRHEAPDIELQPVPNAVAEESVSVAMTQAVTRLLPTAAARV
jgi:hypothetical protein